MDAVQRHQEVTMKENENIVEGYSFSDARDYREAKRTESIEYIKANTI